MKNDMNIYEQGQVELLFCKSEHSIPLHSHDSWCIGIIREGEVSFRIKDQECLLKRGMVYIVPSNVGVTIRASCRYQYVTVCFKGTLREAFEEQNLNCYFLEVPDEDLFMKSCYDFMWNGSEDELVSHFLEMLQPVFEKKPFEKQKNRSEEIQKAVEYIQMHCEEKFDLDNVAQYTNLSKYHLVRLFKIEMGVTPNQYHIQNKLRVVKSELVMNQDTAMIAADLNYADQSHLCKQFKQFMGISPMVYRRNIRKK